MTRLGYQIPNYTYAGVEPATLFANVAAQAAAADRSGFDTVMVSACSDCAASPRRLIRRSRS